MIEVKKEAFLNLCVSHSRLAQAEYDRNPSYNDSHFSAKAEEAIIRELERLGLLDECFVKTIIK